MGKHGGVDDRKAESAAAVVPAARRIGTEEALLDALDGRRVHSLTPIGHSHDDVVAVAPDEDGHGDGRVCTMLPVAALMFRFTNPDAQLLLVMTAAAYCTLRGIKDGRRGWIVVSGALIGFGFLTNAFAGAARRAAADARCPDVGPDRDHTHVRRGDRWSDRLAPPGRARRHRVVGWATRHAAHTDITRAAVIVWGAWLLITAAVFSFMRGIFHEYYTVVLAVPIATMVGIGAHAAWRRRGVVGYRLALAATVVGTAVWSATLLGRASGWNAWLRSVVLVAGVVAALGMALSPRLSRPLTTALIATGLVAGLGGPSAWAAQTASTAHTGSIVTAGPTVSGGRGGGPGFGGGPGGRRGFGLAGGAGRTPPTGRAPGGPPTGNPPARRRVRRVSPRRQRLPGRSRATRRTGWRRRAPRCRYPDPAVIAALEKDSGSYSWVAAAVGSNRAAGLQLATELPVMPIGGSDPSPTLAEFQRDVAEGRIHWFVDGGGGFGQSQNGSSESDSIATWVTGHFTATTIGGITLYDLTATPSS